MKHAKIEHWDDERDIDNSLIVTLKKGWRFDSVGEHVRGFDSKREAMQEVRSAVKCTCMQCESQSQVSA
jgi:hypothetical protein